MTKQPHFYSPEENHLAVIYTEKFGQKRFKEFVTEKEQIWFGPLTRRFVFKEINLGPRTAHIFLSDVITEDQVHFELELKVFYRVDPRDADQANFIQVLKMPNAAFESIVSTNTTEKVRNEVFIQKKASELFSYQQRRELRKMLSKAIADRVRGFGITVNPLYGAAIINLQPNTIYQKAMQEASAAEAQDLASVRRLAASLEKIPNLTAEQAEQLLFLQMASAVNKTGNIPQAIHTHRSSDNGTAGEGLSTTLFNEPEGPHLRKEKKKHQYPVAAD
jgi:hypothetical protein